MYEVIYITPTRKAIITDQLCDEFKFVRDEAARDTDHALSNNYTDIDLGKFLFFTVLCHDDEPTAFFGTQQKQTYPKWIARGFTRYYCRKKYRFNSVLGAPSIFYFYHHIWNQILKPQEIELIFFSREVHKKNNQWVPPKFGNKLLEQMKKMHNVEYRSDDLLYRVGSGLKEKDYQKVFWYSPTRAIDEWVVDKMDWEEYCLTFSEQS